MVVFMNVSAPQEGVLHVEGSTSIKFDNRQEGNGTFYIAESAIYWINSEGKGFSMPYPAIGGFAISLKQSELFSEDSIFIMTSKADEDNSDEESDENLLSGDFQIIPHNADSLKVMYQLLMDTQRKACAVLDALNNSGEDDGDDDDGNYEDAEDEANGVDVDDYAGGDSFAIGTSDGGEDINENGEEMDVEQFEDAASDH